jgi:DNA-binding CsgD family transcriptional regulator
VARISEKQAVAFQSLRELCYQELPAMALLERVTERLEAIIGANASCSHELDPLTHLPTRAIMRGWPVEARQPMIEHVLLISPATMTASFLRSGSRVRTVEGLLADLPEPRSDTYYTHHLQPYGYEHEVQVLCEVRGETRGIVALAPHIGAGLARARVRELLTSPREAEIGMLVVDADGRIAMSNRAADDWLSADSETYWPYGLALLARHIARTGGAGVADPVAPLELPHPLTGAPYRLHWEYRAAADGTRHIVFLLDPVRAFDQPQFLRRLGLTAREADVAVGALRGFTAKEIARQLRCSQSTVAQHLTAIFEKLGVASRTELAARLFGAGPDART